MRQGRIPAFVVSLSLMLAGLAAAQPQPVQFVEVVSTTVKPAAATDYEDFVKKIMAALTKTGAPQRVFGHQVILGGSPYTYEFVLPFSTWGEMDSWSAIPQTLAKAYGDIEAAKIIKAGRAAVESQRTEIYRLRAELSTRPTMSETPAAFLYITRNEIDPDQNAAYEHYLTKIKSATEQGGFPTTERWTSVLGTSFVHVAVQTFNKYAERDRLPNFGEQIRKVYGETEARQMVETSLRAVRSREVTILMYRPDLSRPTTGTTSSQ